MIPSSMPVLDSGFWIFVYLTHLTTHIQRPPPHLFLLLLYFLHGTMRLWIMDYGFPCLKKDLDLLSLASIPRMQIQDPEYSAKYGGG